MVLEGRTRELPQALEDGHEYYGTQTFNQSLVQLVRDGVIDYEDGLAAADNPDELKLALRGITKGVNNMAGFGAGPARGRRPVAQRVPDATSADGESGTSRGSAVV